MGLREKTKGKRKNEREHKRDKADADPAERGGDREDYAIIKDEFVKHGIEIEKIGPHPYGGLVAEARIPVGKIGEMRNALFAHGIVLVSVQAGWGFAIMH